MNYEHNFFLVYKLRLDKLIFIEGVNTTFYILIEFYRFFRT